MHYSIKIGDQTFSVDIDDLDARPVKVLVDGETVELWPEEKPAVVQPMRAADKTSDKPESIPCPPESQPRPVVSARSVTAPIPGVIIEIKTAVGQTVKRGDLLCILEAMKMKNSIRAGRDGVIGSIQVNIGDQVRHGQSLVEFTD
jgi:biotin carboxyl carrier protein